MGALPNLVLIGAPKCGTTALHYYLDLHPQSSMSRPKELNFFLDEFDRRDLPAESLALVERNERNWHRGSDWYGGHFSSAAPVRGESSPVYVSPWYPGVAGRMASVVPDARLLLCVRDPVERAVSHYIMQSMSVLDPGLRAELEAGFREEAESLRAFCGKSFDGWSV